MDCEKQKGLDACTFEHVTAGTGDPTLAWQRSIPGYASVDMDDIICPEGRCPPEVGNVYTYIDDNHITATYVRTAQAFFDERFETARRTADAAQRIDG